MACLSALGPKQLTSQLSVFRQELNWEAALGLLGRASKGAVELSGIDYGSVVSTCGKANRWGDAAVLLHQLRICGIEPSTISYNAGLAACGKAEEWIQALDLLRTAQGLSMQSDTITLNSLVSASGCSTDWGKAVEIVESFMSEGVAADRVTFLASMLACEWNGAMAILNAMSTQGFEPDVLSYNSVLASLEKAGRWEEAVALLGTLKEHGMQPDVVVLGVLASACERSRAIGAAVRLAKSWVPGNQTPSRGWQTTLATSPDVTTLHPSSAINFQHSSVLLDEVLEAFEAANFPPGSLIVDCTLGGAGHSQKLLERLPQIRLLGLDRDPLALRAAGSRLARFGERVKLVHSNYAELGEILKEQSSCAGILADLGVSSPQLDAADRGFSFRASGPLDMRMDPSDSFSKPAHWYIKHLSQDELAGHIVMLGEEDEIFAEAVAARLSRDQPTTTREAARIIESLAIGFPGISYNTIQDEDANGSELKPQIHPATKTFQALRILVNRELEGIEKLLTSAETLLEPGGLLCIISFHGLEDDLVRRRMRGKGLDRNEMHIPVRFLPASGRDGLRPSLSELKRNPRSRSARLRAAVRNR